MRTGEEPAPTDTKTVMREMWLMRGMWRWCNDGVTHHSSNKIIIIKKRLPTASPAHRCWTLLLTCEAVSLFHYRSNGGARCVGFRIKLALQIIIVLVHNTMTSKFVDTQITNLHKHTSFRYLGLQNGDNPYHKSWVSDNLIQRKHVQSTKG